MNSSLPEGSSVTPAAADVNRYHSTGETRVPMSRPMEPAPSPAPRSALFAGSGGPSDPSDPSGAAPFVPEKARRRLGKPDPVPVAVPDAHRPSPSHREQKPASHSEASKEHFTVLGCIRRSTWRALLGSALVLTVALAAGAANWMALVGPSRTAPIVDQSSIGQASELLRPGRHVRLRGDGVLAPEVPAGFSSLGGRWRLVAIGDRLVLVRSSGVSDRLELTGLAHAMNDDVRAAFIEPLEAARPEVASAVLPVYVEASAPSAWLVFGSSATTLFLALLAGAWCVRSLRFRLRPQAHPLWRRLADFGDPPAVAASLEQEMDAPHRVIGPVHVTSSWLVSRHAGFVHPMRRDQLLPPRSQRIRLRVLFLPVGSPLAVTIRDRAGSSLRIRSRSSWALELVAFLEGDRSVLASTPDAAEPLAVEGQPSRLSNDDLMHEWGFQ